jgi:hypothetical protein
VKCSDVSDAWIAMGRGGRPCVDFDEPETKWGARYNTSLRTGDDTPKGTVRLSLSVLLPGELVVARRDVRAVDVPNDVPEAAAWLRRLETALYFELGERMRRALGIAGETLWPSRHRGRRT